MLLLVLLGRCRGRRPEDFREMTLARETEDHSDLDDGHPSRGQQLPALVD